jgi:hypothetical protein
MVERMSMDAKPGTLKVQNGRGKTKWIPILTDEQGRRDYYFMGSWSPGTYTEIVAEFGKKYRSEDAALGIAQDEACRRIRQKPWPSREWRAVK